MKLKLNGQQFFEFSQPRISDHERKQRGLLKTGEVHLHHQYQGLLGADLAFGSELVTLTCKNVRCCAQLSTVQIH